MTLARVRRPICEASLAARKASPSTYTPPWKYRTVLRDSTPSTVISAVGTPPSVAAVTVTLPGSGCAESNALSCRRCSLTSALAGKAPCRRIVSRFSFCSVLTEDLSTLQLEFAWDHAGGSPTSIRWLVGCAHGVHGGSLPGWSSPGSPPGGQQPGLPPGR